MTSPAPDVARDDLIRRLLLFLALAGLLSGLLAAGAGRGDWSRWIWTLTTLPILLSLLVEIVTALRRGDIGLDIVAALSMTAALAIGEALAAVIVALMYAGGEYLEHYAQRRARREMSALLGRVPRTALRHGPAGLEEVPVEEIRPGDRILIRQGDVLPVDGVVLDRLAHLDESALTGEAFAVPHKPGQGVSSGCANSGDAFTLEATRAAAESTYAGIVRLVENAQRSRAPMSRLADRYAIGFLVATVALAAAAWLLSGDPVRAVAVLVVATPCPLILAVPIAWVAGLSRAARHGILVKGGAALEMIPRVRSLILDKTGTLTDGRPRLVATRLFASMSADELLQAGASLEQASKHPMAEAIANAADARGFSLSIPEDVRETPGEGVTGRVAGRLVSIGSRDYVASQLSGVPWPTGQGAAGEVVVAVAVDGRPTGEILLADELRPGAAAILGEIRRRGVERIVLATGDRRAVAEATAKTLPVDLVVAELRPEDKLQVVSSEQHFGKVMMVGDGVNDAPALAAADVGVAMGARGSAATAEAADVVLLVDDLGRLVPAFDIAARSRKIALQSVGFGIGLSVLAMILAAFGVIAPVQGALLQEAIDVSVILNALRALGEGQHTRHGTKSVSPRSPVTV